jgi:hypothetical protein
MPKRELILSIFLATSLPVWAQTVEPGEWEFNAVTRSPLFPGGQSMVFRRCITAEDAASPERWMAKQNEKGQCQLTPGEKTPKSMRWEMSCPRTNMRGSGIAHITGPGTIESELQMSTEFQGHRVQTNTRATGRRVGPCKT